MDFEFTAPPGERPVLSAWWPTSWAAVAARMCEDQSTPAPPSRPARMSCSSPTTRPPSWGVTWRWAGRCRPASSTCSPSSGRTHGLTRRPAGACWALSPPAWTRWAPSRRRDAVRRPGPAGPRGRPRSSVQFSTTADGRRRAGRLLPAMLPRIDLPRALLRGRYMAAAAAWSTMASRSISRRWRLCGSVGRASRTTSSPIDVYGVYDGRTFKADRWEAWLGRNGIPWPRLETGSSPWTTTRSGRWPSLTLYR